MFSSKSLFVVAGLASACALFLGVPTANADTITLLNPSFESPDQGSGNYSLVAPDSWTETTPGNNYVVNGSGAPDLSQWIEIMNGNNVWQNTGVLLQTGDAIVLGASAKHDRTDGTSQLKLLLYAADDASSLGTAFSGDNLTIGDTWAAYSHSGVAGSSEAGKYLTVSVGAWSAEWADIDAVTLTVTHVPEPTVAMLALTGMLGLLCYAWRKRK